MDSIVTRIAAARAGSLLALAVLAGLASGCGPATPGVDAGVDAGPTPTGLCQNTPRPTLEKLGRDVLQGCATSGCHADGAGQLTFDTMHGFILATVRQPSSGAVGVARVVPGVPSRSYLYLVLSDENGAPREHGGVTLAPEKLAEVAGWICGGAEETVDPEPPDAGPIVLPDGGVILPGGDGGYVVLPDGGIYIPVDDGDGGGQVDPHRVDGGYLDDDGGFHPFPPGDGGEEGDGGGTEFFGDGGGFSGDGGFFGGDGGDNNDLDAGPEGPPEITGFDPVTGLVGSRVLLTGAHFSERATELEVAFNGLSAPIEAASKSELRVFVPTGATTGLVTVTARGLTGTSAAPFIVIVPNPAPRLSGLSPQVTHTGDPTTTLVVRGSGFVATSLVRLDGDPLATTFTDATRLTATLPAAVFAHAGSHAVAVTTPTPGGGAASPLTLTVENPAPTLSALVPASVHAGTASLTLRIDGTGFTADSAVTANGLALATTATGATRLDAVVLPSLLANAAPLSIVVTNPGPGGGATIPGTLTVDNPPPAVTAVTPATLEAGSGSASLTVRGSAFTASSRVLFDGGPLFTTFVSGSELRADLDASALQSPAAHAVAVRTPAPGGGTSAAVDLTVANPVPALISADRTNLPANAPPTVLRLKGTKFVADSVARVDGADVVTSVLDPQTIIAQIPTLADAGAHPLVVFSPAPGGGASNVLVLTVVSSADPVVLSLNPAIIVPATPFTLTVTGSGFLCTGAGSTVLVGAAALTPTSCTPTALEVAVPAQTVGQKQVAVRNELSAVTSAPFPLTVQDRNPVPTLVALSPASAVAGSGETTLTALGADFVAGMSLSFDGAALATTVLDGSHATAPLAPGLLAGPGSHAVVLTNPGPGGGTSGARTFTVVAPNPKPTITALTPSSVEQRATGTIRITGTDLLAGLTGTVDGQARLVTYVDATHVDLALEAADTAVDGARAIVLANPAPGGGAGAPFGLTVTPVNPVPVLTSLSASGARVGTAPVSLDLDGSGFLSSSAVRFNGAARPTVYTSGSRVSFTLSTTDLATAGVYPVVVVNPGPGGGTSAAQTFTVSNALPTLATLSPASVRSGGSAFLLDVTGADFVSTTALLVGGSERPTHFLSATHLTVDVLGGDIATEGRKAITAVSPAPGGGTSAALMLEVTPANPVPTVTGLSPCGAVAGRTANLNIAVMGTNFVSGATATFNGAAVTMSVNSLTSATIIVPASAYATTPASSTVPLVVTNPATVPVSVDFGLASVVRTAAEVQQIFDAHCISCHGGSGNLFLSSNARANLVGVPSGEHPPVSYIEACQPTRLKSFLLDKVLSDAGDPPFGGSPMPLGGPPLSADEKKILLDWTAQGAP